MFIALIFVGVLVTIMNVHIMKNILDSCAAGQKEISRKKTCLVCRSRVKNSQKLWNSLDEEQKAIIRKTNEEVVMRSVTKLY